MEKTQDFLYFILKLYRVCFGKKKLIRDNFSRLAFLSKSFWIETSPREYLRGNECWCLIKSRRYSTLILTDGSPCSLPLRGSGERADLDENEFVDATRRAAARNNLFDDFSV